MSGFTTYTVTVEDLAGECNRGKDLILGQLASDGLITKEQAESYSKNFGVVIVKPSLFSAIWHRILQKTRDEYKYALVKLTDQVGWTDLGAK